MREIVVLSGKGGTGKTTVCTAFAALAHARGQKAVLCDLDVDVPDMHILLHPQVQQREVNRQLLSALARVPWAGQG